MNDEAKTKGASGTETTAQEFAGFWRRFLACIIDGIVVLPLGLLAGLAAMVAAAGVLSPLLLSMGEAQRAEVANQALGLGFLAFAWPYFALLESSRKQATLGKMVMRIKVTTVNGGRVSFWRASGRLFAKLLSVAVLYIGFIMVAFTKRKQGLHDLIAGCLVVNKGEA